MTNFSAPTDRTIARKGPFTGDYAVVRAVSVLIGVAGTVGVLSLAGAWVFMPAVAARTVVVVASLGLLVLCLALSAWSAARLGRPSAEELIAAEIRHAGAGAASGDEAGPCSSVPQRLQGGVVIRLRAVSMFVCVVTAVLVWLVLGDSSGHRPDRVEEIARAGALIEPLPVAGTTVIERQHSRSREDDVADYTVRLPSTDGRPGRATVFRARTKAVLDPGERIYVLHAPTRPDLGAVGDDSEDDVRRLLEGRTLTGKSLYFALGLWTFLTAGFLFYLRGAQGPVHLPRRVGSRTPVVEAVIVGTGCYVHDPEGVMRTGDAKAKRDLDRWPCLWLRTQAGEIPFVFKPSMGKAGDLLRGRTGHLVWRRQGHGILPSRRGKLVTAHFVSHEGWQALGHLHIDTEAQAAAVAVPAPSRPAAGWGTGTRGQGRTLDLLGAWPAGLTPPSLASAAVALLAAAAIVSGVFGTWVFWPAVVGACATLGTLVSIFMWRSDAEEEGDEEQREWRPAEVVGEQGGASSYDGPPSGDL